ncbi:MAG: response regulator [Robiginitomaculum sp.]
MDKDQTKNYLILVIEDEPSIQEILRKYLENAGFRTAGCVDGQLALVENQKLKPDLILLDIKLPRLSGKEILLKIREKSTTPIIMVTAVVEDGEKLLTLKNGADDYIIKPFNPNEVVERVKAVLRRTSSFGTTRRIVRIDELEIDTDTHIVSINTNDEKRHVIALTPTEYCLLEKMSNFPFKAFSRNELIETCLSGSDAFDRVVDSHLSNLRRKIKNVGGVNFVESVRGVGYRLCHVS